MNMRMRKALTVYKASAGSGKTFRLATQYIKLVVKDPSGYRNILAVTFTNKATEEMKMRILSQLYGIWKMEGNEDSFSDSKAYRQEVCRELQMPPAEVSRRAGIALHNLLHNYNYFRVQTIDTFFQSVLRNLARELDLTANLRIGLNDTQVEEMAVDQLIDDLQTTDKMLVWIMKYIMDNINDDRSWNVIGQIKQFGKTIFRDYYKEQSEELNSKMAEPGFFDAYSKLLKELRHDAKERMVKIAERFFNTLEAEGLTTSDLAGKERGIASFFAKLSNGVMDPSIVNKTVENCLSDPAKWYAKSHPHRELIHSLAEGTLGQLLSEAVEQRPRQWRTYQSADLTLRHLSQLRLLSSIEQKVRAMNEEANRFLLSDTQQLLGALISGSDTPFIFEKIGTQLDHVMIDEFQDTSTVQWRNFSVLLEETMSRTGSENLIVGDVKQSIYRWRSGDWQLLNDIEQKFPEEMVHVETLDTNRRSEKNIVDFNSLFFTLAEAVERMALDNMPEAEKLKRAYADVAQQVPDGKEPSGHVGIRLLTADDYQEHTLEETAGIVRQLIDHHTPQGKIAILVRTNNLIPIIARYFTEHMPEVRIVSDEAFRLSASPAVCIIIAAMRLLTHPDDTLTKAFLEKSATADITAELNDKRQQLLTLPLYELAEQLYSRLNIGAIVGQAPYVCAFFDNLSDYVADNATGIDGFLQQWDDEIAAKTIQSDTTDGIRLISIHKSKGLEFDNVIIPFCDWQLEKQSGNVLWCKPQEPPYNALPVAPIDYSQKNMVGTIYESYYWQEHLQNVVDNLNLLYVAFTRARTNLYIIGKRGSKSSRSALIEQVLPLMVTSELPPEMLPDHKQLARLDGATLTVNEGDGDISFEYGRLVDYVKPEAKTTANVFLQTPTPLPVAVESHESKTTFRQSNQSRQFVAGDDEQSHNTYIQLGNILHGIFSTIRTKADIDGALRQLESEGILYDETITTERITTMLRQRLEHPKVADWFSGRWKLYNERTIITTVNGETKEYRPDRVMTDGNNWVVVDFKFGRPDNEHHQQVRRYMDLLHQMGHKRLDGYLWYVYSNRIEQVSHLSPEQPND